MESEINNKKYFLKTTIYIPACHRHCGESDSDDDKKNVKQKNFFKVF